MFKRLLIIGSAIYLASCVGKNNPMEGIPMPGEQSTTVCRCNSDLKKLASDKSLSPTIRAKQVQQLMARCEKLYDELGEEEFAHREEEWLFQACLSINRPI